MCPKYPRVSSCATSIDAKDVLDSVLCWKTVALKTFYIINKYIKFYDAETGQKPITVRIHSCIEFKRT